MSSVDFFVPLRAILLFINRSCIPQMGDSCSKTDIRRVSALADMEEPAPCQTTYPIWGRSGWCRVAEPDFNVYGDDGGEFRQNASKWTLKRHLTGEPRHRTLSRKLTGLLSVIFDIGKARCPVARSKGMRPSRVAT